LAYLASTRAAPYPFDKPPYGWLIFPIIDRQRWLGFDIFCAWQDVYLMTLWFFLAGVFTWQSLGRQSAAQFLRKRLLRLGAPLALGLAVVMPIALYPVYRLSAESPSLIGYARAYLALPFFPVGPMWFLWVLMALTALSALVRACLPANVPSLSRAVEAKPGRALLVFFLIVVVAYAPLALAFSPLRWVNFGAFALQFSRPLLYTVYFFAGFWASADGVGRGLLGSGGLAARNWRASAVAAAFSLFLWLGLTALGLPFGDAPPWPLAVAANVAYAVAGACSVLFALGFCLRFGGSSRWPLFGLVSDNALGVYVLHYAPVVWLQYALLDLPWPAPLKAAAVLCGATICCLVVAIGTDRLRRLIEDARRPALPRIAVQSKAWIVERRGASG
jgi:hypothetical protein